MYSFSDVTINQTTENISPKGFNFSKTPKFVPAQTLIIQFETSISDSIDNKAEEITPDQDIIFRKAKPPPIENRRLNNINNNPNVIILSADESNATVILNTTEYIQKMNNLLESWEYQITEKNTTTDLGKKNKISHQRLKSFHKKLRNLPFTAKILDTQTQHIVLSLARLDLPSKILLDIWPKNFNL